MEEGRKRAREKESLQAACLPAKSFMQSRGNCCSRGGRAVSAFWGAGSRLCTLVAHLAGAYAMSLDGARQAAHPHTHTHGQLKSACQRQRRSRRCYIKHIDFAWQRKTHKQLASTPTFCASSLIVYCTYTYVHLVTHQFWLCWPRVSICQL